MCDSPILQDGGCRHNLLSCRPVIGVSFLYGAVAACLVGSSILNSLVVHGLCGDDSLICGCFDCKLSLVLGVHNCVRGSIRDTLVRGDAVVPEADIRLRNGDERSSSGSRCGSSGVQGDQELGNSRACSCSVAGSSGPSSEARRAVIFRIDPFLCGCNGRSRGVDVGVGQLFT